MPTIRELKAIAGGVLSLAQVADRQGVHRLTPAKWRRGIRTADGRVVRLDTAVLAGVAVTTEEALEEFVREAGDSLLSLRLGKRHVVPA